MFSCYAALFWVKKNIIFSGHRPQRWDQDLDRELTGDVSPGATQGIPEMGTLHMVFI